MCRLALGEFPEYCFQPIVQCPQQTVHPAPRAQGWSHTRKTCDTSSTDQIQGMIRSYSGRLAAIMNRVSYIILFISIKCDLISPLLSRFCCTKWCLKSSEKSSWIQSWVCLEFPLGISYAQFAQIAHLGGLNFDSFPCKSYFCSAHNFC